MSQMQSVDTITQQIERLDSDHKALRAAADDLTSLYFLPDNYEEYGRYHKALSTFAHCVIPWSASLPNPVLPVPNPNSVKAEGEQGAGLSESLKNQQYGLGKILFLTVTNILAYIIVGMRIVPWLVAVLWTAASAALLFSPQLLEWYAAWTSRKEAEEDEGIDENPTEWINRELQVMGDKYDAIRGLIIAQDVSKEQLSLKYQKMDSALYSRLEQEKMFFPTECLNIIRKIMVYCNNAYYERKNFLISCLKAPSAQPSHAVTVSSQ